MSTLLTVLHILVAFLLIGVVLIQEPKSVGGGLFSGTGQSLLGTSGKNFWTRFTTGLAVVFFVLCLGLAALPRNHMSDSSIAEEIQQKQAAAAAQAAAKPAPANPAAASAVKGSAPAPAAAPVKAAPAPASKK